MGARPCGRASRSTLRLVAVMIHAAPIPDIGPQLACLGLSKPCRQHRHGSIVTMQHEAGREHRVVVLRSKGRDGQQPGLTPLPVHQAHRHAMPPGHSRHRSRLALDDNLPAHPHRPPPPCLRYNFKALHGSFQTQERHRTCRCFDPLYDIAVTVRSRPPCLG